MPLKVRLVVLPLFTVLFLSLFFSLSQPVAQALAPRTYDIGNPTLQDIWVDFTRGNDTFSGQSRDKALKTLTAAWELIPSGTPLKTGYRIMLAAGSYPEDAIPEYLENRQGSAQYPVIFQSADGRGKVILKGDLNVYNVRYFYLLDLNIIPDPAGEAFHCEKCDHLLLRGMNLSGGNREAQETIKINQSKYVYIENNEVSGSYNVVIDFVAVQYGHITGNRVHNAEDWCIYTKGGSASILIEANEVFDCGTGGISAGQGSGLEYLESPWLHYEAYDLKIVNNIVHDTEGAGLGVNGGYNVLVAHNTLYQVGKRSHLIEVVYGLRSCDGDTAGCEERLKAGGWGTLEQGGDGESIPNQNVYIYNNVVYNPDGFQSQDQHFAIYGPRQASPGSNLSSPVRTDVNLQIKGNVIWNGPARHPLGIEDGDQGCQPTNSACNAEQLRRDNTINTLKPELANPAKGDFKPLNGGNLLNAKTFVIPAFSGADAPTRPKVPAGELNNTVERDYEGKVRNNSTPPGAYSAPGAPLAATARPAATPSSSGSPQAAEFMTALDEVIKVLRKVLGV
jgi:hypothetical protein